MAYKEPPKKANGKMISVPEKLAKFANIMKSMGNKKK